MIALLAKRCWLLHHCLALPWVAHSIHLLVAHKWYWPMTISIPLSIYFIINFYNVTLVTTIQPIIKAVIAWERSRGRRHQRARSTYLEIIKHSLVR